MSNPNQNPNKPESAENAANIEKLYAQIKQTWNKLNDDDIKLYEGNRDQFFAKLQEKQNVSKVDAQKKMQELEKACGCGSAAKAA